MPVKKSKHQKAISISNSVKPGEPGAEIKALYEAATVFNLNVKFEFGRANNGLWTVNLFLGSMLIAPQSVFQNKREAKKESAKLALQRLKSKSPGNASERDNSDVEDWVALLQGESIHAH
jgi:hypothetical protein